MMEEICQLKADKTKEKGSQHDPDLLKRGENVVTKPQGTFVPRWKDVQDDPEPGMEEGVTTSEALPFAAWEIYAKGSLDEITSGRMGGVILV